MSSELGQHHSKGEDPESYRPQLWKEAERHRDHQAQNKRGTYVAERSN